MSAADFAPDDPTRYWTKIDGQRTFLAEKLADDILALGPLAEGIDDQPWRYDSGVWRPDRHIITDRAAQLTGDLYRRSHVNAATDIARAKLRRHGTTIASDPQPRWINMRNGLLDWRTGRLHPHTPDVLSTVQLHVDHAPDATCPQFDEFLAQVLAPDDIEVIWELLGYLLYNGNPWHKAVMLVGEGRNGKGTLIRVLKAIIGAPNYSAVSLHDLVNTRFSVATLFGKLANIAGDIDGKYLESTALLKAVTGEDSVSAEHKGRDRFDFEPWAVPVFSANKIPGSADVSAGYLSRWIVIDFPNSFAGREDRTLTDRLLTELPGITARAIRALPTAMKRGQLRSSDSTIAATRQFRRDVNQVEVWVDECCEVWPAHEFVQRKTLYSNYKRWASRDGHKPVSAQEFYRRLRVIEGVTDDRSSDGTRGFTGLRVVDAAHEGGIPL